MGFAYSTDSSDEEKRKVLEGVITRDDEVDMFYGPNYDPIVVKPLRFEDETSFTAKTREGEIKIFYLSDIYSLRAHCDCR